MKSLHLSSNRLPDRRVAQTAKREGYGACFGSSKNITLIWSMLMIGPEKSRAHAFTVGSSDDDEGEKTLRGEGGFTVEN